MSPVRRAAAAAALLVLVLAGACTVPGQPDAADWRTTARQSLESAASEVATVRLALQQERGDRLLGQLAVVTATDAEEALGSAQDSILTQQPPASLRAEFDRVATVLGDAGDLVTEARIAIVADQHQEYADLVEQLDRIQQRLDELRVSLGGVR